MAFAKKVQSVAVVVSLLLPQISWTQSTPIPMPRMEIVGKRVATETYDPFPTPENPGCVIEGFDCVSYPGIEAGMEEVGLNPTEKKSDARCSLLVAAAGLSLTTSTADTGTRHLTAIAAVRGAVPPTIWNIIFVKTFKITYADGVSETWSISSLLLSEPLLPQPFPGMLPGSGQPEPTACTSVV